MNRKNIIIGLTGSFGSGCTTISDILKRKGFKTISISNNFLKKEAGKEGNDLSKLKRKETRELLQTIGNKKRREDSAYLIKQFEKEIKDSSDKNIVIESLKNPDEIYELKKFPNVFIIAVDTSFNVRVKRILDKEYEGDYAQFKKDDLREKSEKVAFGQHVQKCVDLADVVILNDIENNSPRSWDEFNSKIDRFIKLMQTPGKRYPSEVELWMNNAYSISLKSSCLQRQVGAVIVTKEGYLIASGYNNVPKGEFPCVTEYKECYRNRLRQKIKYCPICKNELNQDFDCENASCEYGKIKLNKMLDKCRSLHAEENAILQASRLGGINLQKASLYCTTFPCKLCANKIVSVGIREVFYVESYPDQDSIEFFKRHTKQVKITKFEGVKAAAFHSLFKSR